MSGGIENLEDMDTIHLGNLRDAGICTLSALLEAGRRRNGRRALSALTNIGQGQILRWINEADLCRIREIEAPYIKLLRRSGVDTVHELRNRNALNLAEKLEATNKMLEICRHAPAHKLVQQWIESAKALPLIIEV